MKKLLIVLVLLAVANLVVMFAGCNRQTSSDSDSRQETGWFRNAANSGWTHVMVVTVEGHRFAIAQGSQECAICEMTDASLVKMEGK